MREISEDVQTEMKKLQEEMDAVFREMCRTSPPLLLSRDLKAAMRVNRFYNLNTKFYWR